MTAQHVPHLLSTGREQARALRRFNQTKRIADLILLTLISPLAGAAALIVAAAVRLSMGAPVIFRQERIGLGGRKFHVLKFRTMTVSADPRDEMRSQAERVTPVGRILRATSLDELPQLLNIAFGHMSFVGPRPLFVRYIEFYTPREASRHWVRPGLTGSAQVRGRNRLQWEERLAHDVEYVLNHSVRADAGILRRTAQKVLTSADLQVVPTGTPLDVARSETPRLRPLLKADLATRVAWMTNPSVARHMQILGQITKESTEAWFESISRNPARHDLVYAPPQGQALAMVGLTHISDPEWDATFYLFVDPDKQGSGHGKTATRLACEYAFYQLGLRSITLSVAVANRPAMKIYESLGFRLIENESTPERLLLRLTRDTFAGTVSLPATGRARGSRAPHAPKRTDDARERLR
ncbi:GNAT family N-acetyltransferase [Geodermatophilus sp. SYSU D00766]